MNKIVPIIDIKVDPNQPRKGLSIHDAEVKEFAENIKRVGIINPLIIDKDNMLVCGELRYLACKLAGVIEVPVRVVELSNPTDRLIYQLSENLQRKDMKPMETAEAISTLREGLPYNDLVKMLGKSSSFIDDMLALAKESKAIKEAVQEDRVDYTAVREANKLPNEYKEVVKKRVLSGEIGTRTAEAIARVAKSNPEVLDEILEEDFTGKTAIETIETIHEITPPSAIETISDQHEAVKRIRRACNQLKYALDALPYKDISNMHRSFVQYDIQKILIELRAYTTDIESDINRIEE